MGKPLKIKTTGGGTWISLQETPDTELTHTIHQILTEFASSTSGTGTLSVGTDTGDSVGTFTDTNSTASSTTTLYQNLTSVSESSIVRPVEMGTTLQETSDANLNSYIISTALSNLVSNGIGSYVLSTSNPDSGRYAAITPALTDNTYSTSTSYNLFRKTSVASAPTEISPLKINGTSIKQMSNTEIKTLVARLRNRIIDTGIGKYAIQAAAPATGTWVNQGTILDTKIIDSASSSYSKDYVKTYTKIWSKDYTKSFTGTFIGQFVGSYEKAYTKTYTSAASYNKAYNKDWERIYSTDYIGVYGGAPSYQADFTGDYSKNWAKTYTKTYTGFALYSKEYNKVYTKIYTGTYNK